MAYIDGFVLSVPRRKLDAYKRISRKAGRIWKEHGAVEYRECVGDDMKAPGMRPFPRLVKPKRGEVIVFSWIMFRSKAQRDRVNSKVMADPRVAAMAEWGPMPFDVKRLSYGGFKVAVDV